MNHTRPLEGLSVLVPGQALRCGLTVPSQHMELFAKSVKGLEVLFIFEGQRKQRV